MREKVHHRMKHPAVVHYKKVDSLHSTLLFWTAKCQKRNNKIFKSLSSCQKISAEILIHCGFFWKSIKKTLGILKLRIIAKVFYANKCVKCHTSIWWKFISKSKSGYEEWKYGKFIRQIKSIGKKDKYILCHIAAKSFFGLVTLSPGFPVRLPRF